MYRMDSTEMLLPIAPKKSTCWNSVQSEPDPRSYAYVAATPRANTEVSETQTPINVTMDCKKQAPQPTNITMNVSDADDDSIIEDNLVQSSLKVNGRQNLTVSAGSNSVFYFHYPLPCEEDKDQHHNPLRRNSAPPPSHHGPMQASNTSSQSRSTKASSETDGLACEEDNDDEEELIGAGTGADSQDGSQVDVDILRTMVCHQIGVKSKVEAIQQRRLVLIGYTGGGKSETGNSILCDRDLFDSLPGFASITKECHKSTGKDIRNCGTSSRYNDEVVVVDTPGLFDTNDDPEVIAKKITGCIINVSPGPHAILLVTPIARMTTEVQQAADGLRKLFGDRSLQYMIVVFTHLDAIKRKKSITGVDQMISMAPPALFRILQECNNRYVAFDNTLDPDSKENKTQVSDLLNLVDKVVEDNGGQCYTNDLLEEANRLMEMEKKRHEKEIEEKFRERESRIRAEYERHLAIVDTKQRQLEEVQEKRRQLEENRSKELQRRIERQHSQIKNKEEEHAKVLETEKDKYTHALDSMNRILDDLQRDLNIVESQKVDLVQRESVLSHELLSAIEERDKTTKYLKQLGTELQKELKVPVRIDPSKPPKSIVDVVSKRVRRCPIL